MPIYEFACQKCRRIYSFLSKRVDPGRLPTCPKCGNKDMVKQISRFSALKHVDEPKTTDKTAEGPKPPMPDIDDARVERVMRELERDIEHLDENNPRHMAYMMKKIKEVMPAGSVPKELDEAIKRLEAGEDPEKIEEDMGDVLGEFLGGPPDEDDEFGGSGMGGYTHDPGLYDY